MPSLTKKKIGEVFKSKDQVLVMPSPFTSLMLFLTLFALFFLGTPLVNRMTKSFPWYFIGCKVKEDTLMFSDDFLVNVFYIALLLYF